MLLPLLVPTSATASPWPSDVPDRDGPSRRLGAWTLRPAAGAVPGLVARLTLPAPERFSCVFTGLTLVAGTGGAPPHLDVSGAVAMRVVADGVADADAAMDAADRLFDLLTGVAGRPPGLPLS